MYVCGACVCVCVSYVSLIYRSSTSRLTRRYRKHTQTLKTAIKVVMMQTRARQEESVGERESQ